MKKLFHLKTLRKSQDIWWNFKEIIFDSYGTSCLTCFFLCKFHIKFWYVSQWVSVQHIVWRKGLWIWERAWTKNPIDRGAWQVTVHGVTKSQTRLSTRHISHISQTKVYIHRYIYKISGFSGGSEVKASASNAGDLGSIPGSGRSSGE